MQAFVRFAARGFRTCLLSTAAGISVLCNSFSARGFDVDNVLYDGFPTSLLTYVPSGEANLAMYDRVEVVRGTWTVRPEGPRR